MISASANVEGAIVSRKWEIIEDVKEFVANFVFSRASWMPISGGGGGEILVRMYQNSND